MSSHAPGARAARRLKNGLLYLLLRALLAVARALPLRAALAAGRAAGRLAFALVRGDRRRALAHLRIAFPERGEPERVALASAAFAHLGEAAAEAARMPDLLARTRIDLPAGSRAALDRALARGRGALYVTAHTGNWELMAAALAARGYPISAAVRPLYDARVDRLVDRARRSWGVEGLARGPGHARRVLGALRRGRVVGVLLDQRTQLPGRALPFFGRPAPLATGALRHAARRGVPVVAGFTRRVGRLHHAIEIAPIPPTPEAAAEAVERAVRRAPDQWVWMHDRWGPADR